MPQDHFLAILANLRLSLKTFLGWVLIFLTASVTQADMTYIISGNPATQKKIDREFEVQVQQEGQAIFLDLAKEIQPYAPKVAAELSDIRAKINGITIKKGDQIQTKGKLACYMSDNSTWTAEPGKRPTITISDNLDSDIFVHEVVSASGVIDDEYQVTGPILAFKELKHIGNLPVGKLLLDSIEFKKRVGTPEYKIIPSQERCVDKNGRATGNGDGTATGVGGGGNKSALGFKQLLILWATEYWKQYYPGKRLDMKFLRAVVDLGVEPLVEEEHVGQLFPVQMDFTFSKRTKKHIVRLKLDDLDEKHALIDATDRIYKHLIDELKTDRPFKYKHCIYGIELARVLKAVDEKTFWDNLTKESQSKERLYKYYVR